MDNIKVVHCPTTTMLVDFLMKPLQGALFRKFKDVLLGYKHFSTLINELGLSPSKGHVEKGEIFEDNRTLNEEIQMKNLNKSYQNKTYGCHNRQRVHVADSTVQ